MSKILFYLKMNKITSEVLQLAQRKLKRTMHI